MAGHPLRSATDRRLGGPLPRQLANQTRAHPIPPEFFTPGHAALVRLCGFSSRFRLLSPCMGQVAHALLTRPPLSHNFFFPEGNLKECFVRLACVKHAASVHPEPGSNSQFTVRLGSRKNLAFPCPHYFHSVYCFRLHLLPCSFCSPKNQLKSALVFLIDSQNLSRLFHCSVIKVLCRCFLRQL